METKIAAEISDVRFYDDGSGLPEHREDQPTKKPTHYCDTEKVQGRFRKYHACHQAEWEIQGSNRLAMAKDEGFYDHKHWEDDAKKTVEGRGQKCTVMNKIKIACDWLSGNARKAKVDCTIVPRSEEDVETAEPKKELLKYIDDSNNGVFVRSYSTDKQIRAGVGWLEAGIRGDEDDEPCFFRTEDWRNIWYDSQSKEPDYSDARYLFRRRKVDLDIALMLFPDRAAELESAAKDALAEVESGLDDEFATGAQGGVPQVDSDYSRTIRTGDRPSVLYGVAARPMVDLIECWYREPLEQGKKILAGGNGTQWSVMQGQIYDPEDELHNWLTSKNVLSLYDSTKLYTRCMVWEHSTKIVLQDIASPYRHNRIPFVPVWCWRDAETGAPYGVIRGLISIQEDLNKRFSKANFMINARQVMHEKGAIDNINVFMNNLARPDGDMVVNEGKIGAVQILGMNMTEADYHLKVMQMEDGFIIQNSGVQADNLGMETNAQSKVAIAQRQNQGSLTTYAIFDNQNLAYNVIGQMILSNAEQFITGKKLLRIVGNRGKVQFMPINDVDENGNDVNPIYKSLADYKIITQDYRETQRQANFEELSKVIAQMPPDFQVKLFDLYLEEGDFKNKDEFVSRVRALNGMPDPDNPDDPNQPGNQQPDPAQELQMQTMQTQLEKLMVDIELVKEKINTEKVNQQVKIAGVGLDDRYAKIDEAKTVSSINKDKQYLQPMPQGMKPNGGRVQGIVSDNVNQEQGYGS